MFELSIVMGNLLKIFNFNFKFINFILNYNYKQFYSSKSS